jgi:hypothetical protein
MRCTQVISIWWWDNIGGSTFHGDYKSFLPLFGTNVRSYDQGTILVSALLVTPLGFDKNTQAQGLIVSVDDFELKLERQKFPGIKPLLCIVLHYTLGLFNGKIRRVGYHVTLQTPGLKLEEHEIGSSEKPA